MVGVAIWKAKGQSICPVLRLLFYLCRPESEATRLSCTYALAQGTTPYLTPSQHTSSVGCQRTHFTSCVWWWSTLAHSKSSPSSRTETRNSKPDNLSSAHLYYNGVMSNTHAQDDIIFYGRERIQTDIIRSWCTTSGGNPANCIPVYKHSLYMQFTRPFPWFAKVGLACESNPEQESGIKVLQPIHFIFA